MRDRPVLLIIDILGLGAVAIGAFFVIVDLLRKRVRRRGLQARDHPITHPADWSRDIPARVWPDIGAVLAAGAADDAGLDIGGAADHRSTSRP